MLPLADNNPALIKPYVTIAIIVICIIIYIWQVSLSSDSNIHAIYNLGVIPSVLLANKQLATDISLFPQWLTLISSMFLHGSWMHLIGNMLFLWMFGNNIESAMGHIRFIVFYLICGVTAALIMALLASQSTIPMIGASGAISGVLGAYLILYPFARVLILIPVGLLPLTLHLPAIVILGLWFLLQLSISILSHTQTDGGIAWEAHIGGFIVGLLLIPLFKRKKVRLFSRTP